MVTVSDNVKEQYSASSVHKRLSLFFPELDITVNNNQIYEESMYLKESILEKSSIEFVGCIASVFQINVNGLQEEIKGKELVVSITTDDTSDEPIVLFRGIVDSAIRQSNKKIKKITAYDRMYTKGNVEVAAWYKSLTFPITLKDFRDSLFEYIGWEQVETDLPNDDMTISREYNPQTLKSSMVMKSICQINGAFGIANRDGNFEYRILEDITDSGTPYPSVDLFLPFYPGIGTSGDEETEHFSYYKSVDYEEFKVKPVDKLTIRQSEDSEGVSYGSGENNYIIQGNMFTLNKSSSELEDIAKNIFANVKGIAYHPFSSDNNGLPFLECGDTVSYYLINYEAESENPDEDVLEKKSFYVFSRELSGIQALRDNYSAQGEEYQSEFITDLQTQIDILKRNQQTDVKQTVADYVGDYTYSSEQIDSMFENFSGGGGVNVESVTSLPISPDENTIYLIQGIVVVE